MGGWNLKGRKTIHRKIGKQMFGKQMQISLSDVQKLSLLIALSLAHVLYLNSFRQLRER